MEIPDTIFRGFQVVTMAGSGTQFHCKFSGQAIERVGAQPKYGILENAVIGVKDGVISWLALESQIPTRFGRASQIQGNGQLLTPGLIDCHTHLIYGGNRANEWEMRLNGESYEAIARSGGGILSTVRATRAATEDELEATAASRLKRLMSEGVTTIEIKSGYGLDLDSELKMLRVARRLEHKYSIGVEPTLLAAHAVPPEYKGRPAEYVRLVCDTIIPQAMDMCTSVDVFCESIAFDLEQTRTVFQAALKAGLNIKVHAEQLTRTGAAAMAAEMGAISADHLEYLSEPDCEILSRAKTVATLLPGAFYCLQETQIPPVGALRRHGVPIAIATDSNPGSSPVNSLLLMGNMACNLFELTPFEALAGITCHAAQALGMEKQIGSIEPGKQADFAAWNARSPAEIIYGIGHNPSAGVFKSGKEVRIVD